MHKILAAAAALGLLALPIGASAQISNEATSPAGRSESATTPGPSTQTAPNAQTEKKTGNKAASKTASKTGAKSEATTSSAKGKREARLTTSKRMAKHGHTMRYANARHGKRFATSHRGRHAFGYNAPRRLHRHHRHHHRVAYRGGCR